MERHRADSEVSGKFKDLVPKGTHFYLRENLQFTEYAQEMILDLIRMGEPSYVACRVAGVNPGTFATWLRKGRHCENTEDVYRRFFAKYADCRLKGLKLAREKQRLRREFPQTYGDEPIMTTHNPLPLALFSNENKEKVLENLRSGMFPGVAAEAAGIPAQVLLYWTSSGRQALEQGNEDSEFYTFYLDYITVAAQARGQAETRVYEDMPLAWLLHGPGRDASEAPGWTKQSQITGPQGGPVQVITAWKTAEPQPAAIEGSLQPLAEIAESIED